MATTHSGQMHTTTITRSTVSDYRVTLPIDLARRIDMQSRADDDQHDVHVSVRCRQDGPGIELVFALGPGVEQGTLNTLRPSIQQSGSTQLKLPTFQTLAWNLVGNVVAWPDPGDVAVGADGNVTIVATVPDWGPAVEADLFDAAAGVSYRTTISKYVADDGERTNVTGAFPIEPADQLGLASNDARAQITMDCVDGRPVLVATPTEKERTEVRNSVAVNLVAAQDRRAQINAARIAAELGVYDQLEEQSQPVRWVLQGGAHLLGFVVGD